MAAETRRARREATVQYGVWRGDCMVELKRPTDLDLDSVALTASTGKEAKSAIGGDDLKATKWQ